MNIHYAIKLFGEKAVIEYWTPQDVRLAKKRPFHGTGMFQNDDAEV